MVSERKSLPVELKTDGAEGSLVALFSTYNTIDHDGDVVVPGAFTSGKAVPIGAWQHEMRSLPIGRGTIVDGTDGARLDGQLFTDTSHGSDTYRTLKGLSELTEWSYIFEPKKWSQGEFEGKQVRFLEQIDVWSVDPVLRGAGIGTGTESIKSRDEGLTYFDHGERALADVLSFAARSGELAELRARQDRSLSQKNLDRLQALHAGLEEAIAEIGKAIVTGEKRDDRIVGSLLARLRLAEYEAAALH